jgi:uncharacterized membrane protein
MDSKTKKAKSPPPRSGSSRRAILRGLGIVLPPLLTIVVLIWAWNTIETYVLRPIESGVQHAIVWSIPDKTFSDLPKGAIANSTGKTEGFLYNGTEYIPGPTGRRYLPDYVKKLVDDQSDYFGAYYPPPASSNAYWHRYVQLRYMPRWQVVPIFVCVFTIVLYFLGRLFTLGMGRWFVKGFDHAILSIPVVNKVYGSVKQVTDFAFSEREIEFNRVVAIQYPREGIWSLGFVTGDSMREIAEATGEQMLSVLMPTSPMPMTGFTVTVKKSEAIDLNLTVDEAIQFVVSCGVVVPNQQRVDTLIADQKSDTSAPSAILPPNINDDFSEPTSQPQS